MRAKNNWIPIAILDLGCLLVIVCTSLLIGFGEVLRILGAVTLVAACFRSEKTVYHPIYYIIVGTVLFIFGSLLAGSVGSR